VKRLVTRFLQAIEKLSRLLALRRLYRLVHDKDTPEVRGRNLLREWLTAEQRRQFDAFGYFDVTGCVSGKRYRIHFGISANVQEIGHDGRPRMGWCFLPIGDLVPADIMLAQKIALETSEAAALAVAKRFPAAIPSPRGQFDRPFLGRI
jgi:hypothetical protein